MLGVTTLVKDSRHAWSYYLSDRIQGMLGVYYLSE